MQPVLPERALMYPPTTTNTSKDILVPGASEKRAPIIPNILKHHRKNSQDPQAKGIAGYDNSVQADPTSVGLISGRVEHMLQPSLSRYS